MTDSAAHSGWVLPPQKHEILARQLTYSCRLLLGILSVAPFAALLLAFIVPPVGDPSGVVLWVAAHFLVAIIHAVIVFQVLWREVPSGRHVCYYWLHVLLSSVHGLLWGAAMWLFASKVEFVNTLSLLTILVAVSAANMLVYSAFRLAALGIAGWVWLQVVSWLLWQGLWLWAVGGMMFFTVQLIFNLQAYRIILGEIVEHLSKTEALRRLDQSHQELDRTNRELAQRNQALQEAMAQLQHLAHHDALTGLPNRRAFFEGLASQLKQGLPGFLVMIDLDHFKAVNDNYGHQSGDEALQLIGSLLNDVHRTGERCARLGGEEFAWVLQETTLPQVQQRINQLRLRLQQYTTAPDSRLPPITLSAGVTPLREYESLENAMARADAALYRAKHNGRNRVELG